MENASFEVAQWQQFALLSTKDISKCQRFSRANDKDIKKAIIACKYDFSLDSRAIQFPFLCLFPAKLSGVSCMNAKQDKKYSCISIIFSDESVVGMQLSVYYFYMPE